MKKILIAILLLIPVFCFAGPQIKLKSVIQKKNTVVASCSGVIGTEDDTPGETNGYSADIIRCTRFLWTEGCAGTVSKVSVYIDDSDTATSHMKVAIYSDDGNTPARPNALLGASAEGDPSSAADGFFDFTGGTIRIVTAVAETYYWLCFWNDNDTDPYLSYGRTASAGDSTIVGYNYTTYSGAFPNPWPDGYSDKNTYMYHIHGDVE